MNLTKAAETETLFCIFFFPTEMGISPCPLFLLANYIINTFVFTYINLKKATLFKYSLLNDL